VDSSAAPIEPTNGPNQDGRSARRDKNRENALDAVLELFASGDLSPSAAAVSERSGVSLRSVYRYYDDIDELIRAAIERSMSRNDHLFAITEDCGVGTLEERIKRFVDQRCFLFDTMSGLALASIARARSDQRVRAGLKHRIRQMRAQHQAAFRPELDAERSQAQRADLEEAIWLVSGLGALTHLYGPAHRTPAGARRAMHRALSRLLTQP